MKARLVTYYGEEVQEERAVELPDDYDGDPYGDTVPFVVGSNQTLLVEEG